MNRKTISLAASLVVYIILILIFYNTSLNIRAKEEEFVNLGFQIIQKEPSAGAEYETGGTRDIYSPTGDVPAEVKRTKRKLMPLDKPAYEGERDIGRGEKGRGYSFSGELSKRKLINFVKPKYPEGENENTVVKLKITANPDGTVKKLEIVKTAGLQFDRNASRAVRQWRFQPLPPTVEDSLQTGVVTIYFRVK